MVFYKIYCHIPYIKRRLYQFSDTNECVLNCTARENSTIHKTIKKIDGAKCNRPAIYYTHFYHGRAVCVQGICKVLTISFFENYRDYLYFSGLNDISLNL